MTKKQVYYISHSKNIDHLAHISCDGYFRLRYDLPEKVSRYIRVSNRGNISSFCQIGANGSFSWDPGCWLYMEENKKVPLEDRLHNHIPDEVKHFVSEAFHYKGNPVLILPDKDSTINKNYQISISKDMDIRLRISELLEKLSEDFELIEAAKLPFYRRAMALVGL